MFLKYESPKRITVKSNMVQLSRNDGTVNVFNISGNYVNNAIEHVENEEGDITKKLPYDKSKISTHNSVFFNTVFLASQMQ